VPVFPAISYSNNVYCRTIACVNRALRPNARVQWLVAGITNQKLKKKRGFDSSGASL
jgi:hypothetical protein